MRCGCPECGQWMVHAETSLEGHCACSECGYTCRDCLGVNSAGFPYKREKGAPPMTYDQLPDAIRKHLETYYEEREKKQEVEKKSFY